jgi:ABC-type nitrate/sulfonate/bicarbonate transport system substrate-binding protein
VRSPNERHRTGGTARIVLLFAAAACAVALGTAGGAGARVHQPVADVGSITIGGVFCTCHLDMYVAWKKGFFAKRGVTVKDYVLTQGGSLTYTGVASGTFDVGAATLETVVRGQAAGQQVKAIGALYPEFWALSVRSDERSTIRKVTDLKGKTIGVSRVGSVSWAFLVGLLGKGGVNINEVNVVQLGDLNGIVAALKAKKVDASVTWEPGTSSAVRGKIAVPIVNLQIPGVTGKVFGSNVSMSQVIAVKADLANNKPQLAQAVVDAVKDADAWLTAKGRKPGEVVQVLKQVASGSISNGTLIAAVKATLKVQPKSPKLTREGYTTSTKLLLDTGALAKPVAFEDVVDCRFAGCGP